PAVHKFAAWFVDSLILKRPDYAELQKTIAASIERAESADERLNIVGGKLSEVLTADSFYYQEAEVRTGGTAGDLVSLPRDGARIYIPTSESPAFEINLQGFYGGRRLLSEETAMLEAVALIASRQIDAMRVTHERCDREFREQEFSKLATEAQLAALRSQINPHFLFNALTTIGYLIQTSPDKAFQTLLQLTKLLRGVLNSSTEFCTVAAEMKLIESYLDIERARFEERLDVTVDIPNDVRELPIPSLILQPLVENSIKHGISENRNGGEVKISAALVHEADSDFLELTVIDSGAGAGATPSGSSTGVGLQNVRERLASHYGKRAVLSVEKAAKSGTRASIRLPVGNVTRN
ncbi:MAG: histidine kinase, partial [Acidobacteriota bacterium]